MTKPLFDVFRATMMEATADSRKQAQDTFVERMKDEPAYLEILARDYFDRMAAVWTVRTEAPGRTTFERVSHTVASGKPPATLVRRTKEEAALRTSTAFEEMKAKVRGVILLNLVLPNGKALREATGADCAKAGGFFTEVAKALKPTQVVDRHLTESDLQNIRARFFQANEVA